MSVVIALGPLAEEDYMRLVKGMLEPKDRLVLKAGCQRLMRKKSHEPKYVGLDNNEPFDEYYPLAVVHRAIAEQTDEAWSLFHDCFSPAIRVWFCTTAAGMWLCSWIPRRTTL
jgi:hypothetical protein